MWKDIHKETYLFLFYSVLVKCETSSDSSIVFKLWLRLPLTHIKANLRIRNDNLHLMVEIIFSYLSPVLISNRSAACLWNIEHSLPIPPETEKTNRVKIPGFNVNNYVCYNFVSFPFHASLEHFLLWSESVMENEYLSP